MKKRETQMYGSIAIYFFLWQLLDKIKDKFKGERRHIGQKPKNTEDIKKKNIIKIQIIAQNNTKITDKGRFKKNQYLLMLN